MARSTRRQRIRGALAIVMVLFFPIVYYYMSPYLLIVGAVQGILAGDALFFIGLFLRRFLLEELSVVGCVQEEQHKNFAAKLTADHLTAENAT